jgi:tetratricopeptide (TPR) repeat protein
MLHAAQGDVAGARALLEAPLAELKSRGETEPTNARIWALRGQIEAILGHRDEALRCARRAIELVPESIDAYEGPRYSAALAFVQAWTGDKDQALATYARLLRTPFSDFASGFSWNTLNPYAMRHSARYAPLHGDPRFEALLDDPKNKEPLF